jgi:energy-coupling factor transporter transmembrane protein EcfT
VHPSIKIFCVLVLAIAVHVPNDQVLSLMAVMLSILLLYYRASGFWRMLRRVRWLLISMVLIFAFNTPGEYLPQWPFELAPTYEGLHAGLLQAVRLCMMLAGLALLLATTNRENLMAGFFLLLYPLRLVKLHPERFAARLWLTLHYVDHAPPARLSQNFFGRIADMNISDEDTHSGPEQIHLISPQLTWRDWLVLFAVIAFGIYLL